MKALTVFRGVPIPVDYASTQTYALLAKRDGGKTYTTLKFEEQMCDAGLFFVTLDPVGKHWALRAGADGKSDGGKKDVWVLGGAHGDAPLEPTAGEVIADTVIEHPGRYVLDVSGFETDADQDRFALAFAKRLFRRKAKSPGFPLLLVLEEAEAFIPERPQSGQQQMLGAFGRIMRQGRNHGLGMWMVAQRAQALNKGVLSQAEVLVVKQMAHKRDRDAVADWVKANGTPEQEQELMASLAGLEREDAWVWSPSWLRIFKHARVLPRTTFDSSASVRGGEAARSVDLVPLDVEALGTKIAQTVERRKAEDPAELRKQIAQLQKELRARPDAEPEVREVGVPTIPDFVPPRLTNLYSRLRDVDDETGAILVALEQLRTEVQDAAPPPAARAREVAQRPVRQPAPKPPAVGGRRRVPAGQRAPGAAAGGMSAAPSNGSVSTSQQRILDTLVWFEAMGLDRPKRAALAPMAGTKSTSGGFKNNLGALRTSGLLDYPEPNRVALTDDGRGHAQLPATPTTATALQDAVLAAVTGSQAAIVQVLIDCYPGSLDREDLADRVGVPATSGGFKNNLGALRTLELVEYPTPGAVVALPVLFMEGVAA